MNIYDYEVKKTNGEMQSLKDYAGKTILIVNTATKCGLSGQFADLEELWKQYEDKNFVVLGFPSNQFASQEPLSDEEMEGACKLNFGVTFPLFAKIDVNGKNEDPLYTYLKKNSRSFLNKKIKWNFTKFLINSDGKVIKRYKPTTNPKNIGKDIEKLLDK